MPELPEVETIVRGLAPVLVGRRVRGLWSSGQALRLARAVDLGAIRQATVGHRVARVRRRGKFILIEMEEGGTLSVHLGMTGRVRVQPAEAPREPHTHLVWRLDGDAGELRFSDARRFGWVSAAPAGTALAETAGLGPDPLTELDSDGLAQRMRGVRAPIKAFLLDQRRVAGLGNIYVCEALFRAGIHPTTPAGRCVARAGALLEGIRAALELAIANRGTTLRDYVDADGTRGGNLSSLLVYGREGEPCARCRARIRRRVDAQRSTFYCPRCQRVSAARRPGPARRRTSLGTP